ncbi:Eco57I restriction-modification methylase domain-containing protein [Ruminococcus flavefaciens]|uniref:site-specific DNA-methyltransferase (adenine-specific) n=1 Tax=Ruminococcus flavefaciens TaxID=1265 RepID=A0A1M7HZ57_RUMFL|nr:N-6 DNA methylase [Ruminococcus flavefaciens]SHM33784.1 Methyltransferase domain-containing protein [Ruminococcus flavefaciens]
MKKTLLKNTAAAIRAYLDKEIICDNTEKLSFEVFFCAVSARYMYENGFETTPSELCDLMPDIFEPQNSGFTLQLSGRIFNMLSAIPHEKWLNNAQIVGQLYQYFNSERKDRIFSELKKNKKINSDDLPAATQIFTPDWIVRYMTENTLGRILAEGCGYDASELEYLVPESIKRRIDISPEDITFLDPCMGSGNILLYAFELFMKQYLSMGYAKAQACRLILTKNIYGIDIDSRARRIAHFALFMKASEYCPDVLNFGIEPQLCDMEDMTADIADQFYGSSLFGSLIRPTVPPNKADKRAAKLYDLLTGKYTVVVTNPPYMSTRNMNSSLLSFIKQNYTEYSSDLFSSFIVRCTELADKNGCIGLLTPYVWLFIKSYEELRKLLFTHKHINDLIQFEYSAFYDATVPLCAFTLNNSPSDEKSTFFRLTDFRGGLEVQREMFRNALTDRKCGYIYTADSKSFQNIPSCPAAYWLSPKISELYGKYPPLGSIAAPRKGNSTSDNDRFLRLWYEVDKNKINLNCRRIDRAETLTKRWFPYNKGGGYRKWYGFNDYLIDWYDDAAEMRNIPTAVIANYKYFTMPGLTWSTLTSGKFSIRQFGEGYIFDNGGCCIFELGDKKNYICALLNSKVFAYIFGQLNPTLNFQSGEVAKFPFIYKSSVTVDKLAQECTEISKAEYDSFETSRDFKRHPLI